MNTFKEKKGYRTFLILWASQSLPVIGSTLVFYTMVLWLTQSVFGDPSQQVELTRAISALSLSFSLPAVFLAPFVGSIVDRYSRRNVMLIANVCGIAIATSIALGMLRGVLSLPILFVLVGLFSLGSAFHNAALDASTIMLVPKKQLPRANGLMQTTWALSAIVAPPLATLLVTLPALAQQGHIDFLKGLAQFETGTPIALSFVILTLLLAVVPLPFLLVPSPGKKRAHSGESSKESMLDELKVGFSFIWQRKPLLWLLGLFALTNFATSPLEIFKPIILRFNLAENYAAHGYTFETALALLGSFQGIGLLAGGIIVSIWGGLKSKPVYGVLAPMILMGVIIAVFGMSSVFYVSAAMIVLLSALLPMMNVHSQAIWQSQTPPELQGRVFAFRRVIAQFTGPLGTAFAGWAGGIIEPATILVFLGFGLAFITVSQFFAKSLIHSPGLDHGSRVP